MAATMERISPFATVAERLRDAGYTPIPAMPGAKVPGVYAGAEWRPMPSWSQWCDKVPPPFISDKWAGWPGAGVCLPHGVVVGLDIDTDRKDVSAAAIAAAGPSPVRRRGRKGWMGYYRPGAGVAGHSARIRWYDPAIFNTLESGKKSYPPQVELLLHGTQSVLPPTIHPDTGRPYVWLTPDTLEDTPPADLPELPDDIMDRLDAEFAKIGLQRRLPESAPRLADYGRVDPGGNDLEKGYWRALNDRAMRAIDRWWPLLGMPKSRQRGPGAWEAVPSWRPSNSGREASDRNPNLKAVPTGIVDFGADEKYTPVSLVMAALQTSLDGAREFLEQYVDPEPGLTLSEAISITAEAVEAKRPAAKPDPRATAPSALRKLLDRGKPGGVTIVPAEPVSDAEMAAAFPSEDPPFPVQDYERDLTGLLRDMTICIDAMSDTRSERGAFGAALSLMSVLLGHKVETCTGLRTNLYIVATAESGSGKSSAMSAMKKLATEVGIFDRIGATDITSGVSILQEVETHNPVMLCVDEFGDVLHKALNQRAAAHERDISRVLKDLFSSASSVYRGKAYAAGRRPDIVHPHLSAYGVSTQEALWESIDGKSFRDGLLARFLLLPIGNTCAQATSYKRFDEVAEGVKTIAQHTGTGNLGGYGRPVVAGMADGVYDRWMAARHEWQRYNRRAEMQGRIAAPAIINRIHEIGIKIAMISAAGRSIDNLIITHDDYDLGTAIAHWSAICIINAVDRYYVENANHKDLKRVLEFIEKAGVEGRTKTQVTREFQGVFTKGKDGGNILTTLMEGGNVVLFRQPLPRGRPREVLVAARHAAAFALANDIGDEE